MNILGLAGSLRRDSYNRRLLAAAGRCVPSRLRIDMFDDLASIPLLDEDRAEGEGPAAVARLRRRVRECDGLLIATPEYNQSVPGVLKNAIDWLSLPRPDAVLVGKPVAIMGATVGDWGTRLAQRTLRQVLFSTESLVMTGPAIYIRKADELFDRVGLLADPKTLQNLERFLAAFAAWIQRTSGRNDRPPSVANGE